MGLTNPDTTQTILAQNTAPEGVITIQDEDFAAFSKKCPDQGGVLTTEADQGLRTEGSPGKMPAAMVQAHSRTKPGEGAEVINDVQIRYMGAEIKQALVEGKERLRLLGLRLCVRHSKSGVGRQGEIIQEDRRLRAFPHPEKNMLERFEQQLHFSMDIFRRKGGEALAQTQRQAR